VPSALGLNSRRSSTFHNRRPGRKERIDRQAAPLRARRKTAVREQDKLTSRNIREDRHPVALRGWLTTAAQVCVKTPIREIIAFAG